MRTVRMRHAAQVVLIAGALLATPSGEVAAESSEMADDPADAVWVTGRGPWRTLLEDGTTVTTAEGIVQVRDRVWTGLRTMSDRRLSGTWVSTGGTDDFGPQEVYGLDVFWSTMRIENPGGAWEGTASGVTDPDGFTMESAWLVGEGGYDGLTAYVYTAWPTSHVVGMIFPGEPPPRP